MKKILLLSALLMTSYFASAQILLKLKLKKGDKYIQKNEYTMEGKTWGGVYLATGEKMDKVLEFIPFKVSTEIHNEVIEVTSKEATIKKTIKRIYQIIIKDNETYYDSDKGEDYPILHQSYKGINSPFLISIDEKGQKTTKSTEKNLIGPIARGIVSTVQFPEKAIKAGDTWTSNSLMYKDIEPIKIANTYTLTKIEKGIAHIAVKSLYTNEEKESITQTGSFQVQISNGLTISASLESDEKFKTHETTKKFTITTTIVK